MSLTFELDRRDSQISLFLRSEFPKRADVLRSARQKMRRHLYGGRPSATVPPQVIGTALDYRIRFYFYQIRRAGEIEVEDLLFHFGARQACRCAIARNHDNRLELVHPLDPMSSEIVVGELGDLHPAYWEVAPPGCLSYALMNEFFSELRVVLDRLRPSARRLGESDEDLLLRFCVVMGALDSFAQGDKAGAPMLLTPEPKRSIHELLSVTDAHSLDDLRAMSWTFFDGCQDGDIVNLESKSVWLNPGFVGSDTVGGADADLIVDGCLIDIKTTINPLTKIMQH